MWKSLMIPAGAAALTVVAGLLPTIHSHAALAQSAPLYITAVDFDVDQAHYSEFMSAVQQDGAASIKEAGVREFNITSSQQDSGHVFLFIVYDDAAAWDSHQKTTHYGKFITTTAAMIKKYDFRVFSSVAMNTNGTGLSGHFFVVAAYLDIDQANFDKFLTAAKENAAASVRDPGCREFNIAVAQQRPHQVLFFAVFYAAAAFDAYQASGHFKKFEAATSNMIVKRDDKKLWMEATYSRSK